MLLFFKKYKMAIIIAAAVVAALVIAFLLGGNVRQAKELIETTQTTAVVSTEATSSVPTTSASTTATTSTVAQTTAAGTSSAVSATTAASTMQQTTEKKETPTTKPQEPKQDSYKTDPIPSGKPEPVEPQEQTTQDVTKYCTLSISCATILDNMDKLDEEKIELVPSDGWLLKPVKVKFQEGESVFDVLVRECKERKIHLSYRFTPIYNSDYIEGIGNLYEFDCGGQSGWNYSVNGWFPNYGSSRYVIQDGDVIEWKYTCNLGLDTGAGNQYE